ncbi:MAG: hypothetical protein K8H88_03115 [Sandaracinaceae bacterium]|nr:hypothetical protein [Sandaracinaceae bacterium]
MSAAQHHPLEPAQRTDRLGALASPTPKLSPATETLLAAPRAAPEPLAESALLEATGLSEPDWTEALKELKSRDVITQTGDRGRARYATSPGASDA